ncbi:hypothetical protein HN615_08465 [Candidatus Woesearchaeota archaeon]|jgi:hypothetical protein|nr:hypothetical protein [Candidatus Woesearchaeota archaeon]
MEVKELSEIEYKEYLLDIKEREILALEKTIKRNETGWIIALFTVFPLAIIGLLFITGGIETFDFSPEILLLIIPLFFVLLPWLVERFKNKYYEKNK